MFIQVSSQERLSYDLLLHPISCILRPLLFGKAPNSAMEAVEEVERL